MSSDFDKFAPVANNWLSAVVRYKGRGRAEFSSPPGVIEGAATATINEDGDLLIEMIVDDFHPERQQLSGIWGFLSGADPDGIVRIRGYCNQAAGL